MQDEEEGEDETYSIWKDRNLSCEFYKYSQRVTVKKSAAKESRNNSPNRATVGSDASTQISLESMSPAEPLEDDSYESAIESLGSGKSVDISDGCGADNGSGTDDDTGNDNGSNN